MGGHQIFVSGCAMGVPQVDVLVNLCDGTVITHPATHVKMRA